MRIGLGMLPEYRLLWQQTLRRGRSYFSLEAIRLHPDRKSMTRSW
jgi:hypothetical protein